MDIRARFFACLLNCTPLQGIRNVFSPPTYSVLGTVDVLALSLAGPNALNVGKL